MTMNFNLSLFRPFKSYLLIRCLFPVDGFIVRGRLFKLSVTYSGFTYWKTMELAELSVTYSEKTELSVTYSEKTELSVTYSKKTELSVTYSSVIISPFSLLPTTYLHRSFIFPPCVSTPSETPTGSFK